MKTKATIEKEPRFTSLVEVLDDAKCSDFISVQLARIETARVNAIYKAGKGAKLKKGPYDYLLDRGMLHPTALIEEFKLIDQKKSILPSSTRSLITEICLHSMQETITYWQKIDEAPEVKKPRAKKKSTVTKV
ncbi:MAG: hypothetical protein M1292_00685 [Bacteroidetes bacterium]|nr:hypothetical protein [Bacteroidota bacterium]